MRRCVSPDVSDNHRVFCSTQDDERNESLTNVVTLLHQNTAFGSKHCVRLAGNEETATSCAFRNAVGVVYHKRCGAGPPLLLLGLTDRKSHTGFSLATKLTTLNDLERGITAISRYKHITVLTVARTFILSKPGPAL